eukprot:385055-Hanusia_phi.AAC.1
MMPQCRHAVRPGSAVTVQCHDGRAAFSDIHDSRTPGHGSRRHRHTVTRESPRDRRESDRVGQSPARPSECRCQECGTARLGRDSLTVLYYSESLAAIQH